ncbi:hypothetical protein [Streptomyces sp. NPDC085665]|uniref:hypothetical protein n=1 Tax=Streptomyces sp. NPDC085665 TaxID=3365735 RepID=UPI0037CD917F
MSKTVEDLSAAALASLTAAGFTTARIHQHSDTSVIATVPAARRTWAEFALMSFTALPLSDDNEQAQIALFTEPEDTDPYQRTVYFRATGPGLASKYVDRQLVQSVLLVPGYSTEADIRKILAVTLFSTSERAADITVTSFATAP